MDTVQADTQENTVAMAAPVAKEIQPQEEAQDNTAAESTAVLEDVLKSKLTLEGAENKTSDSGTGKQENAQTQTKAEAVKSQETFRRTSRMFLPMQYRKQHR